MLSWQTKYTRFEEKILVTIYRANISQMQHLKPLPKIYGFNDPHNEGEHGKPFFGKREYADKGSFMSFFQKCFLPAFSPFPTMFLPYGRQI